MYDHIKTVSNVVNISSIAGVVEAIDAYHVSKQAAIALTKSLYHDLADNAPKIKVSLFSPGLGNTKLYQAEESRPTHLNKNIITSNTNDKHKDIRTFSILMDFPLRKLRKFRLRGYSKINFILASRNSRRNPQEY